MSGRALAAGHLEENLRKRWLSINDAKLKTLKRYRKRQRDERNGYDSGGRLGEGGFARSRLQTTIASQTSVAIASNSAPAEVACESSLITHQLTNSIAQGTASISAALTSEATASVGSMIVTDNGEGFSEVELTALLDNLETAGPSDVGSVLGLSIQSNDVGYFATILVRI